MKKLVKIVCIIIAIAVIALAVMYSISNRVPKSNFEEVETTEALSGIIDKVYEGQTIELPNLQTQVIDTTDAEMVKYVTGLENSQDLDYVVVSEPLMSSQAYSFVLVKVKDGVSADEIAKTMCDNIDNRKWICVTAEKVYATSSGDVACLVMANEETAKPIYEKFKVLAGTTGQEYERTAEEQELPPDMYE